MGKRVLTWRPLTPGARAAAWAILAGAVAAFALSSILKPDARGLGTHEQLYLPPCSMPALMGIPCPFCGMTTAFALAARGRFASAFACQPAGALAAVSAAAAAAYSAVALTRGRYLWADLHARAAAGLVWILVMAVSLAWAYKIAQTPYSRRPANLDTAREQLEKRDMRGIEFGGFTGNIHDRHAIRE